MREQNEKKIVSIEDRIPNLKATRQKKAKRRFRFYLIVLLVLVFVVVYLETSLSHINRIDVSGEHYLDEATILAASNLTEEISIWGFEKSSIEEQLTAIKEVKSARVIRKFPHDVQIEITENHTVGYLYNGTELMPVLENGTQLTPTTLASYPGDAPLMLNFQKDAFLDMLILELKETKQQLLAHISEIHYAPTETNPYQLLLYMTSGFELKTSIRDFSTHLKSYPSIVSQLDDKDPGLIEIGAGGAVFNAFRSSDDTLDPNQEVYLEDIETEVEDVTE